MTETMLTALRKLERRGVITTSRDDRDQCCGLDRDEDGFCIHRPGHPIYIHVHPSSGLRAIRAAAWLEGHHAGGLDEHQWDPTPNPYSSEENTKGSRRGVARGETL